MVGRGTIEELEQKPGSGWLARFMNLGLVLPVTNIAPGNASDTLEVETGAGTVLSLPKEAGLDIPRLSRDKACLYVPLGASDIAGDRGGPGIRARIVRHVRSASNVAKLALMVPGVENYYFEFPLGGRSADIPKEGTDIEVSIDTGLCQLLPDEPSALTVPGGGLRADAIQPSRV